MAIIVIIIIAGAAYYFLLYKKNPWSPGAAYKDGGNFIWTVNSAQTTLSANRSTENLGAFNTDASTITFSPSGNVYSYVFDSAGNFDITNTNSPYQKDHFTKI